MFFAGIYLGCNVGTLGGWRWRDKIGCVAGALGQFRIWNFGFPRRADFVRRRELLIFFNAAKLDFVNGRKLLMPMTFARGPVGVRGGETFAARRRPGCGVRAAFEVVVGNGHRDGLAEHV